MSRKNVLIAVGVVLVGAAVVAANLYFKKDKGLTVTTDVDQDARPRSHRVGVGKDSAEAPRQHQRRNRRAASSTSRSTKAIAIKKGQFLLQIDPKSLRTRVDSNAASLQAAEGVARSRCGSRSRRRACSSNRRSRT